MKIPTPSNSSLTPVVCKNLSDSGFVFVGVRSFDSDSLPQPPQVEVWTTPLFLKFQKTVTHFVEAQIDHNSSVVALDLVTSDKLVILQTTMDKEVFLKGERSQVLVHFKDELRRRVAELDSQKNWCLGLIAAFESVSTCSIGTGPIYD